MRLYRILLRWLVLGCNALTASAPPLPTVYRFNEHPFARRRYGKAVEGGASPISAAIGRVLRLVVDVFTPRRLALLALLVLLLTVPDLGGGGAVLGFAGETLTVDQKRERLETGLKELEEIQIKYKGQVMPQDEAEKFESLAEEMEGHQTELDEEYKRQGRYSDLKRWAGHIPEPRMPEPEAQVKSRIAGYMTLGEYVINCKQVAEAVRNGDVEKVVPSVTFDRALLSMKRQDGMAWVSVTPEEAKQFHEAWETKAVPVIGTGVVEPTRLPGITQVQKDIDTNVRTLIPVSQTSSDQVEYVRRTVATRAAAETAHGAAKPESAIEFDLVTSPVRTIAVHMPVQTQQLADWGQLRSEIDNFLLYDLAKREGEQLVYGDGTGVNLEGIAVVAGTGDISANGRYVASIHTLIDVIRMGMTDTVVAGYEATACLIHPLDWETVELEKGTDNRYVWTVVTDDNGSRMWGMPVLESHDAQANRGSTTEERNIIVADWRRGATIADRMSAEISVGTINAQFTQNLRTILGEQREAFPIRVPAAFQLFQTQADVP